MSVSRRCHLCGDINEVLNDVPYMCNDCRKRAEFLGWTPPGRKHKVTREQVDKAMGMLVKAMSGGGGNQWKKYYMAEILSALDCEVGE